MEDFAVNDRAARRMARTLEDVFLRIDVVADENSSAGDPCAAPVVRDFRFHPNHVMTDIPGGSLLVEFSASGWVEMARHPVSWGKAVDMMELPELRVMLERVRRVDVEVLLWLPISMCQYLQPKREERRAAVGRGTGQGQKCKVSMGPALLFLFTFWSDAGPA